jgi:hypothetical protein
MAVVDELVTLLGFEVDDADAKRFSVTLDRIKRGAMVAGAAVTAAAGAIGAFTKGVSSELDETGKFARSIGVDVEALQELEFATKRAGGSIGDIRGDLTGLAKSLASPIPGEFNQALQFVMGINPFEAMVDGVRELKSADKVLLEVADKLEGLSPQKAQIMAGQLGLSEGTIRLLIQGRDAIVALTEEARDLGGIVPQESMDKAADLEDSYINVTTAIKGVATAIAVGLMPAMTSTIGLVTDWIKENKKFIQQNLGATVKGFTQGFSYFVLIIKKGISFVSKFIPEVDSLTKSFDLFSFVASGVTAALFLATVFIAPLVIKFALIAAAVTGAIILAKDLIKWFKGTGGEFDNVRQAIKGLIEAFSSLFSAVGDRIKTLFDSEGVEKFISFLGKLPEIAGKYLAIVLGIFTKHIDLIAALFSLDGSAILAAVQSLGGEIIQSFKTAFNTVADQAKKILPDFLFKAEIDNEDSAEKGSDNNRNSTTEDNNKKDVLNNDTSYAAKDENIDSSPGIFATIARALFGASNSNTENNSNDDNSVINKSSHFFDSRVNTINNNNNATQGGNTVTITVDGSKSPGRTAAAIERVLKNPMAQTMQTSSASTIR